MFHFYHHLQTLTEKWNSFLIIPASKNKKESTHVACMVRAKKGVMEQDKKVKGEGTLSISPLSPLPNIVTRVSLRAYKILSAFLMLNQEKLHVSF